MERQRPFGARRLVFLITFVLVTSVSSDNDTSSTSPPSSSLETVVASESKPSNGNNPVCDPDKGESCSVPPLSINDAVPPSMNDALPPDPDPLEQYIVFVSIALEGHALPLLRLASAMQDKGYRVAFATHDSGQEWVRDYGVPFLSAGAFPLSSDEFEAKLRAMTRDVSNFRGILTMFNDVYVRAAKPMFDALMIELDFLEIFDFKPDLFVVDVASVGALVLAQKLDVPYILNSPSLLFDLSGVPSYVPAWGTGYSMDMSLWNRCMNILFPRLLSVALTPPFMELNKMRYELDLPPFRSQHDLFKGARVILNTAFGLEHPQPLSPFVDAVGPLMPVPGGSADKLEREELPTSLLSWLDASIPTNPSMDHDQVESTSADGVVYLNLGTMVYIDAWQAQALIDGLVGPSNLPTQNVLWILPTDQHENLPIVIPDSLVIKSPSMSTLEILHHPAVRLVVSHCGMVSAQQALIVGKPLLCIPFLLDQPDVAARVVDAGAGLALDKNQLSGPAVHAAVTELLTNNSYTRAARRVGSLLERAGGTSRAIDVIDTAVRLGFDHLATLNLIAPWHKMALLDVWAVFAALICLLAVVLRAQWLLLYFLVSNCFQYVCKLLLGSPHPSSPVAEEFDEPFEDGDEEDKAK